MSELKPGDKVKLHKDILTTHSHLKPYYDKEYVVSNDCVPFTATHKVYVNDTDGYISASTDLWVLANPIWLHNKDK